MILSFSGFAFKPTVSSFQHYSIDEGLSQVTIYDIEEDQQGFVWLATQRGVDRFDGYDFVNLGDSSLVENKLQRAVVLDIEVHPFTQDMWFATRAGLHVMRADIGELEPEPILLNAGDNEVMALEFDQAGNAWVGTKRGVYVIYDNTTQVIPIWTQKKPISVDDLRVSPNNILWVSTSMGLKRYDTENKVWLPSVLDNEVPTTLLFRNASEVWVGTTGNGVFVIQDSKNEVVDIKAHLTMESGLANAIINDLKQASDGTIWVATTNGVSIISINPNSVMGSEKQTSQYRIINLNTLNENARRTNITNALSIHHREDGQTIIGTFSRGVFVVNTKPPLFERVDLGDAIVSYSVAIEDDDNVWVTTDSGLFNLNAQNQAQAPITENADANQVPVANILQDLAYSKTHKEIFLGSRMGLRKLDKETQSIQALSSVTDLVYSITEANNGMLFLGTRNTGLFLYDPAIDDTFMHWDTPLSFKVHLVNETEILVPTTNGLYAINTHTGEKQVFKHDENNPNSLPYNVVTWVSHISGNQFFVGTQSKGLQVMTFDGLGSKASFEQLFPDSRLSSLSIGSVTADAANNYWVTTTEGIARINTNLDRITYFGESDGANGSGYFIGASAVNSQGRIYFAGPESVTTFNPSSIIDNKTRPKLQFTNIKTLHQNQDKVLENPLALMFKNNQQKLVLQPNNVLLSLEFAALEFASPDKIEYAYMLEGFHSQWQFTDSAMRSATFTNLSPGDYIFKVKASNRYQEWSDDFISLELEVLAPWWRTKMAIAFWVLISATVLFLLFKWRVYAVYQREEILKILVAEKTLDLENANEKLKLLSIKDPLTGTLNRRGFVECAEREMAKFARTKHAFSIILLDIDLFKHINDQYGHELGDCVLVQTTEVIQSRLRGVDIMARWGGEEFILLLPETPLEDAYLVANQLKKAVANKRYDAIQLDIKVTFSAGVCEIQEGQNLDECIKLADEYLYKAKHNGRNLVCCN